MRYAAFEKAEWTQERISRRLAMRFHLQLVAAHENGFGVFEPFSAPKVVQNICREELRRGRGAGSRRTRGPSLRRSGRDRAALRHTYASWACAAGVGLFELARVMGTSLAQIDATYGHLLPDSLDRTRTALDTFQATTTNEEVAR